MYTLGVAAVHLPAFTAGSRTGACELRGTFWCKSRSRARPCELQVDQHTTKVAPCQNTRRENGAVYIFEILGKEAKQT